MASTFSPTLRLELIGDGDQSGIWGQTTNNNLGGLLEQSITGVITISMLDANYILSSFNGVVDEARNQVLVLTGALSTQRNLIAPLVEKTYTIKNTTTGGFGVQIIGASGTGVIIPNGTTASVYCDGVNFFPTSTGSLGNHVINGNLAVTGTTALTGALTASTATFSGAISSVNPVFTGTPTAPTALAGTSTTQIATTAFVQNVAGALGTMSSQNANNVAITGGSISGLSAPLPVASGGTGAASLAANNVLLGNGTSAVQAVAPGAAGNLLVSNGSSWTTGSTLGTFSIIAQGEFSANTVHTFSVANTRATLVFAYFGNGFNGNSFLFSNIDWGMPTLNQNRVWYSSGVDFQVAQSGSLMAAFNPGSGSQLQVRVNANFVTGYGSPGTVRIMVIQF
jgi:hypothetical protein